ncbi:GNAT family N-acetyltransferase [Butyrivibrio sp. JL13D10]|uniref:GNAT family N-acetyltransferase n=1 Tax=Butyrivibrio sp. JL13D10 TaxID=3236815 RepID=UPI0038B4D38D
MKKMRVTIRRVQRGDESTLAFLQTESWKTAFKEIVDPDILRKCTDINKATSMYKSLLDNDKGNGYLLFVDEKPHCLAYWDAARDEMFEGKAELIAIHSLPENRYKGYGKQMMERVLSDITSAGYKEVILWVFTDNKPARAFYESVGFEATEYKQPALGTEEMCYRIVL